MGKKWDKDSIKHLLATNDRAVGRALLALWHRQTFDEQTNRDAKYKNNRGFCAPDAFIMTRMAEDYRKRGYLTMRQIAYLRKGTSKRYPSRIGKYWKQLLEIAKEKQDGTGTVTQ